MNSFVWLICLKLFLVMESLKNVKHSLRKNRLFKKRFEWMLILKITRTPVVPFASFVNHWFRM